MPGSFIFCARAIAFGRNDFEHAAVFGLNEIIAVVGVIDDEVEMIHVPLRQLLRIRRGDRRML